MLDRDALSALKTLKTDLHDKRDLRKATIKGTKANYSFAVCEDGSDVFIPPPEAKKTLPGDSVEIEVHTDKNNRQSAKIEKLFKPSIDTFVGRCIFKGNNAFVKAQAPFVANWIFIPPPMRNGVADGDYISGRISKHPYKNDGKAQAKVLRIIAKAGEPGIETAVTRAIYELDFVAPKCWDVNADSVEQKLQQVVDARDDLSDIPFITIDASSTRDMDDAIYAEKTEQGWQLRVAIADPACLVEVDSDIDKEARHRGSSSYFAHNVMNMLPEAISTQSASLVPSKVRPATVIDIAIGNDGSIGECKVQLAAVKSAARLTYQEASRQCEGETQGLPQNILQSLDALHALADARTEYRGKNNLISQHPSDYRFKLDDQGQIEAVQPIEKSIAHRIVEECMLATNISMAHYFANNQLAGLFVTHKGIKTERYADAAALLKRHLEKTLGDNELSELNEFVQLSQAIKGDEKADIIEPVLVRMYARSELKLSSTPHFGMGFDRYLTFTSPIRRYQDFYCHQVLQAHLAGSTAPQLAEQDLEALQARIFSLRGGSNEADQWLLVNYAEKLAEQDLNAEVIRANHKGLGVRLACCGLEGFVPIENLNGKHSYDSLDLKLYNDEVVYRVGQPLTVRLDNVDHAERQVHFKPA